MSKRKLTKQQLLRIKSAQESRIQGLHESPSIDDSHLMPEEEGLLISRYGPKALVEDKNGTSLSCDIRQNLEEVVPGDRVIFRKSHDDKGVIVAVMPRKTLLTRHTSSGQIKPLAANITQMVVVFAPEPEPSHEVISRYLVAAELLSLKVLLLCNKTDLLTEANQSSIKEMLAVYEGVGYSTLSIHHNDHRALEDLKKALVNNTNLFVGQSGVGKSSLIRQLLPQEHHISVGAISERKGLGKHTTTVAQLYHFPLGGDLIDSPGVRRFNLWAISSEELLRGFPELKTFEGRCKYRNCLHEGDEHCAIQDAVKKGLVNPARLHTFLELRKGMIEK